MYFASQVIMSIPIVFVEGSAASHFVLGYKDKHVVDVTCSPMHSMALPTFAQQKLVHVISALELIPTHGNVICIAMPWVTLVDGLVPKRQK